MKASPRTLDGAAKVFMPPAGTRQRTFLPLDQAIDPSSRAASASIHLPFSSAMSWTAPSTETATTRPSSPPVMNLSPEAAATRMEAPGCAAMRCPAPGVASSTVPSSSASAGTCPRKPAAATGAPASSGVTWAVREAAVMISLQASRGAAQEALGNHVFFQIAADEDEFAHAFFVALPFALEVAVEKHVHTLKDEALGLVLEGEYALRAQDRRALLLHIVLQPGHEFFRIDIALNRQRHRLHVFVMIMF